MPPTVNCQPSTVNCQLSTVNYSLSELSLWLAVDPLSDKYPGASPYVYCANNPVRLVDPDGRKIGDYYDLNGNYLGWDGIDDRKVYVVTGQPKGSPFANPRMQYDEDEIHRVPASKENRAKMVNALIEFDKNNPNAEWGGLCGIRLNSNNEEILGKESNHFGLPSEAGDPSSQNSILSYTQLRVQDIGINGFYAFFDYHSHGSGGWEQEPSKFFDKKENIWKGDIPNAKLRQPSTPSLRRTFAVFAMEYKQIYFYNEKGTRGEMSFDTFINIGH